MNSRLTILIPVAFLAAVTMAPAMELKDITFKTANAGKVVFSHNTHLGKKSRTTSNLSCKECHKNGVGKIGRFTMADMEKGKSGGACHNGRKAFTLDHC